MENESILFITPLAEDFDELFHVSKTDRFMYDKNGCKVKKFSFFMPMGALALASWTKKIKPEACVNILDCNSMIYSKIKNGEILKGINFKSVFTEILISWVDKVTQYPNLIGISLNTTIEYKNFLIIAETLKEFFPNSTIIAGGVTASFIYKDIFQKTNAISAIVVGEGEIPLEKLLTTTSDYETVFNDCSAFATFEKNVSQIEPINVQDLDILPEYDFNFLENWDLYFQEVYNVHNPEINEIHDVYIGTSRGCVFDCYFCNTKNICGKGIRYFSDEYVFNTIDNLCSVLKNSRFNCITFTDELIYIKFDRAKKFLEYCKQKGIYGFTGNDSFITASEKTVDLVKKTGPGYVTLPLESGSERVLKNIIKKPFNLENVPRIIKLYKDAGLIVRVGVLIGFPSETKQDIEDEIAYYKTLEIDWLGISFATPFPGTDLYDDCVKYGYLTCKDLTEIRLKNPVIATEHFSIEYLKEIQYFINLEINFKNNYNMKIGNYSLALKMFAPVLEAVPDHAFAYYYASICYKFLGEIDKSNDYYQKYKDIIADSSFWLDWAVKMGLDLE